MSRPAGVGRWILRLLGAAGAWLVVAAAAGAALHAANGPVRLAHPDLAAHGVPAQATVTQILANGWIHYSFTVDAVTVTGEGRDHGPHPPGRDRRPGDTISVVYDARRPATSCACDPAAVTTGGRLSGDLLLAGFVVTPPFVAAVFYLGRRRGWSRHRWTGWPVSIRCRARCSTPATSVPFTLTTAGTRGWLSLVPGRACFVPDPGRVPTPDAAPAVVHTRLSIPLAGNGARKGVYLYGNPLYGADAVIWLHLPDSWHVDDIAALLTAAGFDVLRVPGPPPLAGLLIELPTAVRHQMHTSPELWA